jgi:hypothetical protein
MAGRDVRRLRPELYDDLESVPDRGIAERMEQERAIRLAEAGFAVHCDGVTRTTPNGRIRPFGEQELWGVADLFDGAVFGVIARRTRLQTKDEIASVLRWEEGSDLGDTIRTPWEQVGTFAHVELAAVHARLAVMLDRGWIVKRGDGTVELPPNRNSPERAGDSGARGPVS